MELADAQNWRNGDIIETKPQSYPFFSHFAVLVQIDSVWWVIHNIQSEGVNLERLDELLLRHEINSVFKSKISGWTTEKILERFKQFDDLKYSVVYYNCESFINDFTGEKPRSLQSIFFGIFILVVLFFILYFFLKYIQKKAFKS